MSRVFTGLAPVFLVLSLGLAFAKVGSVIPNPTLPAPDGSRHALVDPERLTVFLFFDPAQPRCLDVMGEMSGLQKKFPAGKVRWVGIVSDRFDPSAAAAAVQKAGLKLQLLLDPKDRLYGGLEVRLYPTVGIVDSGGVLRAYLPYHKVNFTGALEAEIRHALGEIDDAALDRALHPKAVDIGTASAEAGRLLRFARMLWKMGQRDKALATARQAVEAAPSSAEAHALAGTYLAAMGRCDEALPSLERALELDPGNEEARTAMTECKAEHAGEGHGEQ